MKWLLSQAVINSWFGADFFWGAIVILRFVKFLLGEDVESYMIFFIYTSYNISALGEVVVIFRYSNYALERGVIV
jgi:hypothetical protein